VIVSDDDKDHQGTVYDDDAAGELPFGTKEHGAEVRPS
jgi:hypothetical protein